MKHYRIFLAIAVLVLALLACQAVTGGGSSDNDSDDIPGSENGGTQPEVVLPTEAPSTSSDSGSDSTINTEFPMTQDAYDVMDIGDGSILFYTKLSAEDAMDFYRQEYTSRGYTEREILTVVSSGSFSMVFDGDPGGKAVVIQSVDLGNGSRTVAIRLEDV